MSGWLHHHIEVLLGISAFNSIVPFMALCVLVLALCVYLFR